MADLSQLKKPSKGKGVPPPVDAAPGNTNISPREKERAFRLLQFKVSEDLGDNFDKEAARLFGFKHGAKKQMFLKIWEYYNKGMKP